MQLVAAHRDIHHRISRFQPRRRMDKDDYSQLLLDLVLSEDSPVEQYYS